MALQHLPAVYSKRIKAERSNCKMNEKTERCETLEW
jgi:hypothetical protein